MRTGAMVAEYAVEGLADSALLAVQGLLPGCSVAAGVTLNGNRAIRTLGAVGRRRELLLEGQALMAAYKAMRERATQTTPLDPEHPDGDQLISTPITGRDRVPFGVLQVLTAAPVAATNVQ